MSEVNKEVERLFHEGLKQYEVQNFIHAEENFLKALELEHSEDILYNLALVYLEQGKYELVLETVGKIKERPCLEIINEIERRKDKSESEIIPKNKLPDSFGQFAKGSFYISVFLLLIVIIGSLLPSEEPTSKAESFFYISLCFIGYNLASWFFYGYHAFTQNGLKNNKNMFIWGTIIMTGGGWWPIYLPIYLFVKLNLGVAYLINKKKKIN